MPIYSNTTPHHSSTYSISSRQDERFSYEPSTDTSPLLQNMSAVKTASSKKILNFKVIRTFLMRAKMPRNQYYKEWKKWEKDAPTEEKNSRKITRLELHRCLRSKEPILDLNVLGLSSIPMLPSHIIKLNVELNKLKGLPKLPDGLRELNCAYNRLVEWPPLPNKLKNLDCSMNRLVSLPDLPDGLEELNCSRNSLFDLPQLPNGLKKLNCYINNLVNIHSLPPSLEYLYAGCNALTALPVLPNTLQLLECSNNHLQHLPRLPPLITSVSASDNELNELPEELPIELDFLQCMGNSITTLPESITQLNRLEGRIDFRANPLSERTIQNIYAMINESNYRGPQIYFSMATQHDFKSTTRPLTDNVITWFPPEHRQEVKSKFSAIANEENAEPFSAFIYRLHDTCSAKKDPLFKQCVAQWLSRLSEEPKLRATTFAIAQGATESCEDRVALTWNDMQKMELIYNIEGGLYDNKLPEIVTAGREMFRLEQLEHIAREKASTLRFLDEIEVYLGFQTQLKIPLELTNITKEMRFFGISGITESDLNAAELRVKTGENQQFPEWLALWSPWQKLVQRTEPTLWDQAYDKKMDIYESEYQNRINTELSANGLIDDVDAERELGIKIMHDIDKAIFIPLTQDVLASKKQESLLNKKWNI